MSMYLGDFALTSVVRFMWNSNNGSGGSVTRATNGTISVYKDGNTTQTTTGVTDTEDFDSLTGVHLVAVDTSSDGTFYSTGSDFSVVLSGATIDGQTVNAVLAQFSLNNRSALRPTVAGRTLDVSSTGEGGVDWGNVGSPTTSVTLSSTTVGTVTSATLGTNGLPAAAIATAAGAAIADYVLRRQYANARQSSVGDSLSFRSPLGAIGKLINRVAISGSTLTVYQEDDVTSSAPGGTQAVTTSSGADPITELNTN